MAKRVEGLEGVIGLELGLPSGIEAEAAARIVEAATGELPILARLPLEQALQLTPAVLAAGAAAVSLGPPRGVLCDANGKLLNGRLYGPSLFPMALHTVRTLARMGATVIGAGGIYSLAEVEVMLAAGASAVQLDIILWQSKFGFAKGLGALCGPHNTIKFRSNKEQ
jgi:dihydroorotate dehydrogenase (NAD+) catalytic subunit